LTEALAENPMNGKPGSHEHRCQNVIEECVRRSHQGTISFGEVVAKLMDGASRRIGRPAARERLLHAIGRDSRGEVHIERPLVKA
jgi:hypothetical protein